MRGPDTFTEGLFTMRRLDDFVPADHPLRRIRMMVNEALAKMDELFSRMYEADVKGGRPSIAPEKLLRAMLLQILFSIRSERQLMEQTQAVVARWLGTFKDFPPRENEARRLKKRAQRGSSQQCSTCDTNPGMNTTSSGPVPTT